MKSFFIFQSLTQVMAAEKVCLKKSLKIKLESAPRELSSDCGISLSCDQDLELDVDGVLKMMNFEYCIKRI